MHHFSESFLVFGHWHDSKDAVHERLTQTQKEAEVDGSNGFENLIESFLCFFVLTRSQRRQNRVNNEQLDDHLDEGDQQGIHLVIISHKLLESLLHNHCHLLTASLTTLHVLVNFKSILNFLLAHLLLKHLLLLVFRLFVGLDFVFGYFYIGILKTV